MKRRDNKRLYEQIMNGISTEIRHALNELSPEVYRRAADKRQAQIDALPTKLRNKLGVDKNAPAELRTHADKIEAEERIAAKKEAIKEKRRRTRLIKKTTEKCQKLFNDKGIIKYYSQVYQANHYSGISINDSDNDIREQLADMWIYEISVEDLMEMDSGGYDYEQYCDEFSEFTEEELEVIIEDIIPDIIQTKFDTIDLSQSVYIDDAWNKSIKCSEETQDKLDNLLDTEVHKGVIVEINNIDYLYYHWGELIPIKKLGFKYCLSGDFRGEVGEVIDEASSYDGTLVIQYPEYSDCIVLCNSKRTLNKIEKYLWDSHIMAFGGISTV